MHARETGRSGLIIPLQINLASSYRALDSLALAMDAYSEALELAEREQNEYLDARMSMNMGNLLVDLGEYDSAIDYLMRAYTLSLEYGLTQGVVLGLVNLGNAYLESGQYEDALDCTMETYQAELREQEIELTSARLEQQTRANPFLAVALLSSTGLFALGVLFFLQHQQRLKRTFELRLREIKRRPYVVDLSQVEASPVEDDETTRFRPLYQQIQQAMEEDRLFKDPGLTLGRVARAVASNEKYVSLAIREITEMKFNDYINMHRIQYAERLILEKQGRISPAEVMEECGFNSKSTFYTAFKSFTDLTPGQFIRMVKERRVTTCAEED